MKNVETLYLDFNALVGSVPNAVFDVGSELIVDCGEVRFIHALLWKQRTGCTVTGTALRSASLLLWECLDMGDQSDTFLAIISCRKFCPEAL